jgi:hypothetical protein
MEDRRRFSEFTTSLDQQRLFRDSELAGTDADAGTKQAEVLLARLYPIEQAIMQTPAHTITGLGVKARHMVVSTRCAGDSFLNRILERDAFRIVLIEPASRTATPKRGKPFLGG